MATGGCPPGPLTTQPDRGDEETVPSHLCVQCKTELKDPHFLCCLHFVCEACLGRVDRQDGRLKCPECEDTSTHPIPDGRRNQNECPPAAEVQCVPVRCTSLAQHMENSRLLRRLNNSEPILCNNRNYCESPATVVCFNCNAFMCHACNLAHVSALTRGHTVKVLSEFHSMSPLVLPSIVTPTTCPNHNQKSLKYFCHHCDTLLCQACILENGPVHQIKLLDPAAVAPHAECLVEAKEAVVRNRAMHQEATASLEAQCTAMNDMKEKAHQDAQRTFQTIHAAIEAKEEDFHSHIDAVASEMKRSIKARAESYRKEGEFLASAQTALSFLLTKGSSHEVVNSRKVSHMKQSTANAHCEKGVGEALVFPVMRFLPQQEEVLLTAIRKFGHIHKGACTVDPKPDTVHQFPPIVFTLTVVDTNDVPCSSGGDSVQAFLRPKPPIPGPAIKAEVKDKENGQYEVVFTLVYSGECKLLVLVNGRHVRGSPFAVHLDAAKGSLPFPKQPGNIWGIAVSPASGDVFAVDHAHSQILIFDAKRKHTGTFGEVGNEEGQLMNPVGIDADNGCLYVANQRSNCVSVFTEDGTFIKSFGAEQLKYPRDVLVHKGEVYVADSFKDRIAVFSQEGNLVRTFGSNGRGNGEFDAPSGVAVSPNGNHLYISDRDNYRVQVFTLEGQYVRTVGTGLLKGPRGLVVTYDGRLLVADRENNRVAVFDTRGKLIHLIKVEHPVYLAVDSRGDLLVSSPRSVHIF